MIFKIYLSFNLNKLTQILRKVTLQLSLIKTLNLKKIVYFL